MYKHTLITAAAALALSGAAFADDSNKSGGLPGIDVDVDTNFSMPMADKNSDGKISKSEAASNERLSKQFTTLDTNKDGSLDKGEFAKFEGSGKARTHGNKDGAPGKDEGTGDERSNTNDNPGTMDDSVPGNKDKVGPGR